MHRKYNQKGSLSIGIIFGVLFVVLLVIYSNLREKTSVDLGQENQTENLSTNEQVENIMSEENTTPSSVTTTADGLQIEILKEGSGAVAENGKKVTVHYTGTFESGEKFDSSRDRGTPFTFTLGAGQVIKGWDEGVLGMKVGEQRKLTIPYTLGYGADGYGPIPPKATLIFEVELLNVI